MHNAVTKYTGPERYESNFTDSDRNAMKLISKILFLIYYRHKKQHWGGRKAEILNRNFTIRDTYNIQPYKLYLYKSL